MVCRLAGSDQVQPSQVPVLADVESMASWSPYILSVSSPFIMVLASTLRQLGAKAPARLPPPLQVSSFTASFDATLLELASEKLRMEAECLAVDTRLLAGRQELAILQECQVGETQQFPTVLVSLTIT